MTVASKKNSPPSQLDSTNPLQRIFGALVVIAKIRRSARGIVVVLHQPSKRVQIAMSEFGVPVRPKGTTVWGMSCSTARAAFGFRPPHLPDLDPAAKQWLSVAPLATQIKVLLVVGDEAAQLTLPFSAERVQIVEESEGRVTRHELGRSAGKGGAL